MIRKLAVAFLMVERGGMSAGLKSQVKTGCLCKNLGLSAQKEGLTEIFSRTGPESFQESRQGLKKTLTIPGFLLKLHHS
jgi:hypothetical protein